jgi:DNA replication licensing factor MCM4
MKSALQTSAVDPTTGNLDMSMINTGISSSTREIHRLLPQEIQKIINEMNVQSGTIQQLLEKIQEQTTVPVTFSNICSALETMPSLVTSGATWRKH